MNTKVIGLVLGILGVFLWFMPWAQWQHEFRGETIEAFQAGHHVGGIAYLVLIAATAYSVAAWKEQGTLQIVSAAVWLACTLLLFFQGDNLAWGMFALLGVAGVGLLLGVWQRNGESRHTVTGDTRG